MGYTTDFCGTLKFDRTVEDWLVEYINKFSFTRRMKRDNEKIKKLFPNWKELCFNGNLGDYGEYFVGGAGFIGQERDNSILDYNRTMQPGLWCQWIINDDGELEWDGGEKFYNYEEWLQYLIDNFFEPLGYTLNGDITWQGEDYNDFGTIHVKDNKIEMQYGIRINSLNDISTGDLMNELVKRGYNVTT